MDVENLLKAKVRLEHPHFGNSMAVLKLLSTPPPRRTHINHIHDSPS